MFIIFLSFLFITAVACFSAWFAFKIYDKISPQNAYNELKNISLNTIEHKTLVKKITSAFQTYLSFGGDPFTYAVHFHNFINDVLRSQEFGFVNYKGSLRPRIKNITDSMLNSYKQIDEFNSLQNRTGHNNYKVPKFLTKFTK